MALGMSGGLLGAPSVDGDNGVDLLPYRVPLRNEATP